MPPKRFFELQEQMYLAFNRNEPNAASDLAHEYLTLAKDFRSNWNYGNAIHHSNLILGRIALRNGETMKAKEFLLKAGKTSGSPQLNSFGPNMMLARELLEKGEKDIVLMYIDLSRKFWNSLLSWRKTRKWKRDILNDKLPDFGAHLHF